MKHMKIKGFTMIEVCIVIAIIGLLLAIAIPNIEFAQFKSKAKLTDEVYAKAVWAEAKWDMKEALRLVANEWTPPTVPDHPMCTPEPASASPVLSASAASDVLVCPKCKFVFGKYRLIESQ